MNLFRHFQGELLRTVEDLVSEGRSAARSGHRPGFRWSRLATRRTVISPPTPPWFWHDPAKIQAP